MTTHLVILHNLAPEVATIVACESKTEDSPNGAKSHFVSPSQKYKAATVHLLQRFFLMRVVLDLTSDEDIGIKGDRTGTKSSTEESQFGAELSWKAPSIFLVLQRLR